MKSAISPRPASWILERSFDGVDFFPWQYFGVNDDDCRKRYNIPGQNEPYKLESDDQIICSTQFSKAVPLENGEVCFHKQFLNILSFFKSFFQFLFFICSILLFFSVSLKSLSYVISSKRQIHLKLLEGRPGIKLKNTPTTLLDFTLARYLRLRFQGMHTTLQAPNSIQWLVDRNELKKRSFYSLKYIKIGARLDCNGHAQRAKQYNDDEVSKKMRYKL